MSVIFYGPVLRAGRALAGISQLELAKILDVHPRTVARLEEGDALRVDVELIGKVRVQLEKRGVEFTEGSGSYGIGVRYKSPTNVASATGEPDGR
jgi:transcriptional regulator with XRE-family HTH domain